VPPTLGKNLRYLSRRYLTQVKNLEEYIDQKESWHMGCSLDGVQQDESQETPWSAK
jgi:hypothetical protein